MHRFGSRRPGLGKALALASTALLGAMPSLAHAVVVDQPTANELPDPETAHTETPTPNNPLGAKGVGESGTIGSAPAVWNAVLDALAQRGIRHLDMPCTPDRVWAALNPV